MRQLLLLRGALLLVIFASVVYLVRLASITLFAGSPVMPTPPPTSSSSSLPPEAGNQQGTVPTGSGGGKYVLFSPYGQHNNQLITLVRALNIAHRLNRTLVLAPFARKKGREVFRVSELYDYSRLTASASRAFGVVDQESFLQGYRGPTLAACVCPTEQSKPAAAANLQALGFRCAASLVIANGSPASALIARLSQHDVTSLPFVYVGQAFFFPDERPLSPCPWGLFDPSPSIAAEVRALIQSAGLISADATTGGGEGGGYVAVHLRGMSGECDRWVDMSARRFRLPKDDAEDYRRQCRMDPDYVLRFAPQLNRTSATSFFLATDDQNPHATHQLERLGGKRYRNGRYHPKSVPAILVDLWAMAGAEVFVGNGASTFSMNVCRLRLARGKDCTNFHPLHKAALGLGASCPV